jgi:hypothetical protein
MDEERVTSPTGGSKGRKLARFDLIPTMPLRRLAEHFGRGATKYTQEHKWQTGLAVLTDAMLLLTANSNVDRTTRNSLEQTIRSLRNAKEKIDNPGANETGDTIPVGTDETLSATKGSSVGASYENTGWTSQITSPWWTDKAESALSAEAHRNGPILTSTIVTRLAQSVDFCADDATKESVCLEIMRQALNLHSHTCRELERYSVTRNGLTESGDRNWERGYDWSLSYAAAQRHLNAFWGGEDWDPEFPESHHLDAAMFHLMALRDFVEKHPNYDDRAKTKPTIVTQDDIDNEMRKAKEFNEAFGTQETSSRTTPETPRSKQTQGIRRVSDVQASRWEVP